MSNLFNLTIGDYNNKELEDLLSISFPYTKNDVIVCGEKMKNQLLKDPSLPKDTKGRVNTFIENATQQLTNTLTDEMLEPKLKKNKVVDSGGHMLIAREKDYLDKPTSNWRGTVNPFSGAIWDNKDKLINRVVNIDSLFRNNYYNTTATDFRVTLPIKLKNVVSMSLSALELPLSIYAISSSLKNNFFRVVWYGNPDHPEHADLSGATTIVIPDGNYTDGMISCESCIGGNTTINPASLAWQLNFELAKPYIPPLSSLPPSSDGTGGTGGLIAATIDQRTGKVIIGATATLQDLSGASNPTYDPKLLSIELYFNTQKDLPATDIGDGYPILDPTTPIQQKLGWMLGYRFGSYLGSLAYTTEGRYDFRGPRYLYLVVDDFHNNHIGNHLIGAFSQSLTPGRENILARLSWKQYAYFSTNNEPLDRSTQANYSRNYFGPVDIEKLHIKILDQYGRVISLNNMDFALALNFTMLYH